MKLSREMQRVLVCVLRPAWGRGKSLPDGTHAYSVNDMSRECFATLQTFRALLKRKLIEIRVPKAMEGQPGGIQSIFSTVHITETGMPIALEAEVAHKARMAAIRDKK